MTEAPEPTPKEKQVLQDGLRNNRKVTIGMIRKHYDRSQSRRAAKRMVEKGYLRVSRQPGGFLIIDTPWDENQTQLEEPI